jgi:hypothetical protein
MNTKKIVGTFAALTLLITSIVVWRTQSNKATESKATAATSTNLAQPVAQVAAGANAVSTLPIPAKIVAQTAIQLHIIGNAWMQETRPELRAFSQWTEKYLAADATQRAASLAEGVNLAQQRRDVLKQLIKTDPQAALAAAVPMGLRSQLPTEVLAQLEDRVSTRGDLYTLAVTPREGETPARPTWQVAEIAKDYNKQYYDAFTYGDRLDRQNEYRRDLGIHGIAIDKDLAVLDSDVRVLEAGEVVAASKQLEPICGTSGINSLAAAGQPLNTDLSKPNAPIAVDDGYTVIIHCRPEHVNFGKERLLASGGSFTPSSGSSDLTKPGTNLTSGVRSALVIRVDTSDEPDAVTNSTPAVCVYAFMRPNGVNDWYIRNSHGNASMPLQLSNVTPVYRLPSPLIYYKTNAGPQQLHADARALAQAGGFNVTNYQHVFVLHPDGYIIPTTPNFIDYGGLGSVGGSSIWLNGSMGFGVLSHEAGHNMGLVHANSWNPTNNLPLGDAAILNTPPSAYGSTTAGLSLEYGDNNDMLGGGGSSARAWVNPWFATFLSWIPDSIAPGVAESGVYRIYRYDHQNADTNKTFAIKIRRDGFKDYWVAYRRQFTGDPTKTISDGAYVFFGYHNYRQNDWVKISTNNVALNPGQTLNDTNAGIAFTTLSQAGSGTAEYIDVSVALTPQIEWAATNLLFEANSGNATLTLSRTRDFSGAITVNYQTENITATAGSDYTGVTNSVTWTAGDHADKTINVAVSPSAANGKQFRVRLTGLTGGINLNNPSAVVTFGTGGVAVGGLWRQYYGSILGYQLTDLTGSPKFPNQPDSESVVTSAEAVLDGDNYGQRLVGFITAPQTASYTFWAASYWDAQVFVGTNDTPASKQSVLDPVGGTSGPRVYENGSAPVALVAGQRYYFEVLHKQYGPGYLAIAWTTNSVTQPPNSAEPIPGSVLSYIPGGRFEPYVTTPPANQLGVLGGSVTFSVNVGGASPRAYQWRKAGAVIATATNSSYVKSGIVGGDAVNYDVIITNSYGSVTSSVAALTIGTGPVITNQPASLTTVGTFQTVNLSVGASGTALTYQWRFNTNALGFQTSSTLTIPSVGLGQAGNYDVIVANNIGSVTSSVAVVVIGATPVITNTPISLAANPGGFALFSVGATGAAPLTYQWRKNGTNLSGATSASVALSSLTTGDAGGFDVVVANSFGSVTSAPAVLSVTSAGGVAAGGLWRDFFQGITITNLYNPPMSDLTNNAAYPNSPTSSGVISSFETPRDLNIGDYGQHLTGYVLPPVTGNYRFFLAADQTAQLYLSTNQLAANKVLIAENTERVNYRYWDSEVFGAASGLIPLVAGQRYYVEVLHVSPDFSPYDGYLNNLGVAWQTPADSAPPALFASPIPGNYLAYDQRTFAPPGITVQPTNVVVGIGSNATFTVTATNATGYLWRKVSTAIGGENDASLTLNNVSFGDATNYSVVVGNLGGSVTSSVVSLTLIISVNTNPTNIIASVSGTNFNLSWPADHIGWRLLAQTNNLANGLSSNTNDWATIVGSASTNQVSVPIDRAKKAGFFRLIYP